MLNFEEPEITSFPEAKKPFSLANKGYPYNHIADDRRFEELIYSIYKTKIDHKKFDQFDSINILNGVRDKGRDCVLYKKGKANGVIQCKLYKNPYSKNELGLEITKFTLYSLLDERLVDDYSTFTYYICTANGLTTDCLEFINDFQSAINSEPQLNKWVSKCLEKPTLESLKINFDIDSFKEKISKITVKNISSQDIDLELNSTALSHLIPLFFEVRTVIDSSKLDELGLSKPNLTIPEIYSSFRSSSVSLSSEKNEFNSLPNSHIARKETELLYNWIINDDNKSAKNKNICLLVGSAGYGKTVILKDLYDKCMRDDVAVLGLKADKLYPTSIDDLQKNISTPLPLIDFIQESKKHFSKVVILIDQIDALSQSISSDRRFLNVFRNFLDIFLDDENVKVILSVRPYELNYDPSLQFYKESRTFYVQQLDKKEVNDILKKAGVNPKTLSIKLLQLLRVPNQLDVFLQIAANGISRIQSISLHGLYFELWNQKITDITKRTTKFQNCIPVKKLLYTIANDMYAKQRISISLFKYEDHQQELNYLESERLLKREGNQIQFFHQSFYDFVFSKQLVEQDTDVTQYIKDAEQSIHIRSAVKMTFAYLREYDFQEYIKNIHSVFDDQEILFHIKHVIFTFILSLETPLQDEITFVKMIIRRDSRCELLLLEMARASIWFDHITDDLGYINLVNTNLGKTSSEIELYKTRLVFNMIQNQITSYNSQNAWEILATVPDKSIVQNLLYDITDWSNPLSYQIFESCVDFEENDSFGYYHILDNILSSNPNYVIKQLAKNLSKSIKHPEFQSEYQRNELLKKIIHLCPDKLYPILFECIIWDLKSDRNKSGLLINDWVFFNVDFTGDEDFLNGTEYAYKLLGLCLKKTAKMNHDKFFSFLNEYKDSKYESILRLIIFALQDNEMLYADQIYDFFITVSESKIIEEDESLETELRILIGSTFTFFTSEQKQNIIDYIKQYRKGSEVYYYEYGEPKKKHFYSIWGKGKYFWMISLPLNIVSSDNDLKKSFQELERRYKNIKDQPRERCPSVTIGTSSPVNPKAYSHMSKEQWISAFRKYDSSYVEDFHSSKGGIHELTSGFRETIRNNPRDIKLLDILNTITKDSTIDINYVFSALEAFAETRKDLRQDLIELLKVAISRKQHKIMYYPIRIASMLSGSEKENPFLLTLLTVNALNYNCEEIWINKKEDDGTTTINGLLTQAINSNYGTAIIALVHIKDRNCENLIFDTVESILESGPSAARAIMYNKIAYLSRINVERTYNVFLNYLAKEQDIYVIASSLWSLQYLKKHGFNQISSPFEKLIDSNLLGDNDASSLFKILYGSYLYNIDGAKELLYNLIKRSPKAASRGVRSIFKHYYSLPNSKEKNDTLLDFILKVLTVDTKEKDLSLSFLKTEHLKLKDIYHFISNYIKSPVFVISNYFVEYLCQQCTYFPLEAIELFNLAFEKRQLNNSKAKYIYNLDESFIKFIIGAYDSLTQETEVHSENKKRLLKRFDEVLQDYKLRTRANKILETLT